MKRTAFLSLFLLPTLLNAQGSSVGEANLKLLFPARTTSMAEAAIADSATMTSYFANPACLASSNSVQVMFSQMQWIQDIQTQQLATSLPTSLGSFVFALSNTSVNDIPIRDTPGPPLGTFDSHSTVFQLGYAFNPAQEYSIGASVKYLYDKLYQDEATGYGLDLGVNYRSPIEGASVALAILNVGKMNAFRSQKTDLPTRVDAGIQYAFSAEDFGFLGGVVLGHETASDGLTNFRVGGEVTYEQLLAVRIGYQTGYDIRGLSAGLGIEYSLVQLDYAYVPFSQGFGNANIITIGFKF